MFIHVKSRIETEGFYGWTNKDGLIGVRARRNILKNMLTIRIHLDDMNENNGALHIIRGTQNKTLSPEEIQTITTNSLRASCEIPAGGVHVMRPLLFA